MNPLQHRLATLRRRLRFVVTFRGACWLGSLLFLAIAMAGLVDWRVHLPAAVRALLLAGTLGGAGYVAYRHLIKPLAARADDLALALRIEEQFPELNDSFASAVQFLERAPARPAGSLSASSAATLESEAVQHALKEVDDHDFSKIIDERGVRLAWLSLMVAGSLAVVLSAWQPTLARTALIRFADPYGGHDWPRQTQLAIQANQRAARGEAFIIYGMVRGVVPEKASVVYRFADNSPMEQACDIARHDKPDEGCFTVRLEPERVKEAFRFQVRANDAVSEWHSVTVLPPPQLVPLDGRPSPQVRLQHPAYSALPDLELPDGGSSVEALAGTRVTVRGATDRPVARAWLEFPSELTQVVDLGTAVGCVGDEPVRAAALAYAAGSDRRRIRARIDGEGQRVTLEFVARVGGVFVLHLEDDTGLGSTRLFEVRVIPDPAPTVQLERPAKSLDSFDVLPGAEVTLQLLAEDAQFALRSAWVAYKVTRAESPAVSENGQLVFADHIGTARVQENRRWSLKPLSLREGDVVRLQAFADDFDDVTMGKPAGRSHEVELRIVSRTALERLIHDWQTLVQQELLRLGRLQQDALKHVISAEAALRNRGRLEPMHVDEVVQAEQLQQQLRARVGTSVEGLRADIARILQALRDNQLPGASGRDRMDITARELERLAREHLDQVEPHLTQARKDQEAGDAVARPESAKGVESARPSKTQGVPPNAQGVPPNALSEARKHQEEIRRTLQNLLKLMEPWSSTSEIKGEARMLLEEQRKLARELERLSQEIPTGASRDELKREQEKLQNHAARTDKLTEQERKRLDQLKNTQAALDQSAELQNKLAERFEELLGKMDRAGAGSATDQATLSQELQEAAQLGRKANVDGEMRSAEQSIREAALGRARDHQRRGTAGLEQLVQALEEREGAELDRLAKSLRAQSDRVGKLTEAQDELRKKTRKAAELSEPTERARELQRLAREQEKIRTELEETLRELNRLRRPEAQQSGALARDQMEQAARRMADGADPGMQQDETLDRLDDARRDLEEARRALEEELTREKLAKLADQIKGLRDRQESRLEESGRIHAQVLERAQWTRGLRASLLELARAQEQLGKETTGLAEAKLADAEAFGYLLRKAAVAMEQAAERIRLRNPAASTESAKLDRTAEQAATEALQESQRTALRCLDYLLEALKPDPDMGRGGSGSPGGGGGGDQNGPGRRGAGEGVPPVAELKVLKALQQDLNERTRAFAQKDPDATNQAELAALRKEQQKIAELFHKITSAMTQEGDKP